MLLEATIFYKMFVVRQYLLKVDFHMLLLKIPHAMTSRRKLKKNLIVFWLR